MKKIYIVGAGGFGREVAWLIEDINEKNKTFQIMGFIDEDFSLVGTDMNGYKVLGNIEYLNTQKDSYFVVAIGNGSTREKIINKINKNIKLITLIHPEAKIHKSSEIGDGSIIARGVIISTNCILKNNVIINCESVIGHDCVLDENVSVMVNVNISGNVCVGKNSIIGSGSVILQGKKIGQNCIVGIGSSVIKNVKDDHTAFGVPASNYSMK